MDGKPFRPHPGTPEGRRRCLRSGRRRPVGTRCGHRMAVDGTAVSRAGCPPPGVRRRAAGPRRGRGCASAGWRPAPPRLPRTSRRGRPAGPECLIHQDGTEDLIAELGELAARATPSAAWPSDEPGFHARRQIVRPHLADLTLLTLTLGRQTCTGKYLPSLAHRGCRSVRPPDAPVRQRPQAQRHSIRGLPPE
jgi:hypothetical protein